MNNKRSISLALFVLAALVVAGAWMNCRANPDFGALAVEMLGGKADLEGLRRIVLAVAIGGAALMVLIGWRTWKGKEPGFTFLLSVAATLLLTVFTVFCRQQGGNFLSQVVNTLSMICSFLALAIANRERR